MIFLSSEDLVEMTGYKTAAKQAAWLAENGYKFDVRADGRPNVLVDQVRARQVENTTPKPAPDLSWLE